MRIEVRYGLDIRVGGAPDQRIAEAICPSLVGLDPADFFSARPVLCVGVDDPVAAGQAVFRHPVDEAVTVTSPVAGRVVDIVRGDRRRVTAVVISPSGDEAVSFGPVADPSALTDQALRERLLQSGTWCGLRARPHEQVASPAIEPRAIFVTAIDTRPLSPDPGVVIAAASEDFVAGLGAMARLTRGQTWLCTAPDAGIPSGDVAEIRLMECAGPHPAGLPGTHIHASGIDITLTPDIWHIGYQDVIAAGRLLRTGRIDGHRVVALAGPGCRDPRLIRMPLGARLADLASEASIRGAAVRSGSPLPGDAAARYLGRYDCQITIDEPAVAGIPGDAAAPAMLPLEKYEDVWPYRTAPVPLLRALLTRHVPAAEELGCLGLAAEDLSLLQHVCPVRIDYGAALRDTLAVIEKDA